MQLIRACSDLTKLNRVSVRLLSVRGINPVQAVKIRVKNRDPVPVYAMDGPPGNDRDSELGDDSPMVSALIYNYHIIQSSIFSLIT